MTVSLYAVCMQCKKGDKSNKTEVRLHLKLRSQIQGLGDREGVRILCILRQLKSCM